MAERAISTKLSNSRWNTPRVDGLKKLERIKPSDPKWTAPGYNRSKINEDATHPVGIEKKIENVEAVLGDLEERFHSVFGHKIKTLGLVEGISPEKRRKIIKVCVDGFSGFDKETGRVKEEFLPKDGKKPRDVSPENDPILSQVPEREWRLCEDILYDLNIAYISLDNLIQEDRMG